MECIVLCKILTEEENVWFDTAFSFLYYKQQNHADDMCPLVHIMSSSGMAHKYTWSNILHVLCVCVCVCVCVCKIEI